MGWLSDYQLVIDEMYHLENDLLFCVELLQRSYWSGHAASERCRMITITNKDTMLQFHVVSLLGAKEEGALGVAKGVGRGTAGLLLKPIGGLIDFTSSTLTSVKQ